MKYATFVLTAVLIGSVHAQTDLKDLRPGHPRLIWTIEQIGEVKQVIAEDPLAKEWHAKVQKAATTHLAQPLVAYSLTNKKLLVESRAVLDRVTTLAGLYRLDGDERFLDRARKEMLNAAAFPDWNPASFLATAEMTNALALGYDWLYDKLGPAERATLRQAIIEKGLKPGLEAHAAHRSWTHAKHNWNAVCNGGLAVGALAIADADPAIAIEVLDAVRKALPRGMLDFAPDGGWPEGASYWDYTTIYNAYSFAALHSALGTDFDFTKTPGFSETGDFRIQMLGNSGRTFNFADAGSLPGTAAQMFWLARLFDRPEYDAFEREIADRKPTLFHLIWFNRKFSNPVARAALKALPRSRKFDGVQVAILRSGQERTGTFVGIKGGDNRTNHAHLDLGSFVLDHGGERFADELGSDSYTLPGYFGTKRWSYYRLRTEGQNAVTLDGENQNTEGSAKIISFCADDDRPFAVIDLTGGYPNAEKVLRGVALDPDGNITLQDEIAAKKPVDVIWHFHTEAAIAIQGSTATLTKNAVQLHATILEPSNAVFSFEPAPIAPPQRAAGTTKRLTIELPEKVQTTRIIVSFGPQPSTSKLDIRPLEGWHHP